jgi:hypothetical protein
MRHRRTIIAALASVTMATGAACAEMPTQPTAVYTPPPVPSPAASSLVVAPDGDDEAAGTAVAPLRTIDGASRRAQPGMTVLVRAGTYTGDIVTAADGTEQARIAYLAESAAVKIVGTGANPGAWENDGDYVDIVGFDITGPNDDGLWSKGSHVRLMQNRVHHVPGNCIYTANDDYSLTDIDVLANVTWGCGEDELDHGIYIGHRLGIVANNMSYRNSGFGIQCWHACDDVTIINNLVFGNPEGGIVIGGANDDGTPVDNSLVANNIVVDNGREGIREGGDSGPDNRFVNNLLWDNERDRILVSTGRESGTIVADPQFVAYRRQGSGDYHLQPTSPAVDTGTSDQAPPVAIDLAPRPLGRGYDVGIYER